MRSLEIAGAVLLQARCHS